VRAGETTAVSRKEQGVSTVRQYRIPSRLGS
jgi:hypothetical protein